MTTTQIAKGTSYHAHFTHTHIGFSNAFQRETNRYRNLGFRTFRNARASLTRETPAP